MSGITNLFDTNLNVEKLAQTAVKENKLLSGLLRGILSKQDTIRYNSYKVLYLLSETHPGVLYPYWDFFADLINSDNSYHTLIGVRFIANLTAVDTKNKFERRFDTYYNLLDAKVMVAAHLARNSGKIALAKPHLEPQITSKLLNIEKSSHKHKELIKASVIEAFEEYFPQSKDKQRIIQFVENQLESPSPKTRKAAQKFLKKWDP